MTEPILDFTAPPIPEGAQKYMPETTESFGEGLLSVLKAGLEALRPELGENLRICVSLVAVVLLIHVFQMFSQKKNDLIRLTGCVMIGLLLLEPVNSMVRLASQTVLSLSEYGKLLLPVMTAALAAQGGGTSSAALYAGTVFFDAVLTTALTRVAVPLLFVFLALSIGDSAVGMDIIKKLRDFIKWLMTWSIKLVLYLFTGYISITHVITGVVDSSALKAAKLTISGAVPVVGGILADASETILVSAGVMKNAAGVYGIIAIFAICVSPFLKIGVFYLLLKMTTALCGVIGTKQTVELIQDFTSGMGFALAMTGTVCLLLLISLVCFIKGIGG